MVGTLVRLQLRLYWRSVRGNRGAMAGLVFGALYAIAAVALVWGVVTGLRARPLPERAAVATVGFGALVLMRLFLLFMAGQEQSLDAARFALLPVSARRLLPGLLAAAFATPGPWFLVLLVLESSLAFTDTPTLLVATVACGLLGLVLSTLMCRVLVLALSGLLQGRRFRDLAGMVVMAVAMCAGLISQGIARALSDSATIEATFPVARVVGWTPWAWPWAVVGDLATHSWLAAGVRVLLTVAACVALWLAWGRLLARALTSPLEAGGAAATVRSGRLADRLVPRTPAGAIAARTLRYYRRDPRHVMQLLSMVLLPVLMVAPQALDRADGSSGFGRAALMLPILIGLFLGSSSLAQELALDGSALWTEVTAGITGRQDRWARLLAFLIVAVPLTLLIDVGLAVVTRQAGQLLVIAGAGLGSLGVSSAVACVSGALVQTPQPPPGASPFARRSGGSVEAVMVQLLAMAVAGAFVLPFGLLGWFAWDRTLPAWLPLAAAMVMAPLLLWLGCVLGGRVLDRTWPEVLQRVSRESA